MHRFPVRLVALALALIIVSVASACGTYATPEWASENNETTVAQAATESHETVSEATATAVPATATAIPPTQTPVPPVNTVPPETSTPAAATATAVSVTGTTAPPTDDAVAGGEVVPAGDAVAGQTVFQTAVTLPDNTQWGCFMCHSAEPGVVLIGPSLFGVSDRATQYGPEAIEGPGTGDVAHDYIYTSIHNPQHFIAPVTNGQAAWPVPMPNGFTEVLTEQQVADVIAYVMTLK